MRWAFMFLAGLLGFTAVAQSADINADELWLRQSIPGQANGAGFGVIYNLGDEDLFLIGGSIAIAGDVEVHRHVREGDQMRMEAMDALTIPAGSSIELVPGGYHLMLMGLSQPLAVGDKHALTLIFSDGSTHVVNVEVRELVQRHQGGHRRH